jgi:large subunit ribosomal protein L17
MRHGKHTFKIGRTASHRRCMLANMLKPLIEHGRIETTVTKAKELRRHADRIITLAKKNTLATRRRAVADLMVSFNTLTPKQARLSKAGKSTGMLNNDRQVMGKLFGELSQRFAQREGGYTRIIRLGMRAGDNAPTCLLEFLA